MNEAKRGKFIVFEGLDGAGKTSCIDALRKELTGDILFIKEPGGTPFGEKIRTLVKSEHSDPLTQLFLFLADRREHMKRVTIPALQQGTHVIADRFMASTYAFQIVAGGLQKHEDFFWKTHEMLLEGFVPDHYFFVTITPEQARERMLKRPHMDHFEENMEFQAKVREGYETFMKKVPSTSIDGGVELSIMQKEAVRLVKDALRS
jgi:dTMP kinase